MNEKKKSKWFYIFDRKNKRRYKDEEGLIPRFDIPFAGETYIKKRLKGSTNFILRREK